MTDDHGMIAAGAPRVSVVMAVHNGERYLNAAIGSVLAQTFGDFELIIVDDGSSDSTPRLLAACADSRVHAQTNERNIGLAASLNRGLARARGAYIARMDADDVALPLRFEKQVAFLDQHPEVGILGSNCAVVEAEGRIRHTTDLPLGDIAIRWRALLANPFAHPTVMLRHSVLEAHKLRYDETLPAAQDFELWSRVLAVTRAANLAEPLLRYRSTESSLTTRQRRDQLAVHDRVVRRGLKEIVLEKDIDSERLMALRRLFAGGEEPLENFDFVGLTDLYLDLWAGFATRHHGEWGLAEARRDAARRAASALRRARVDGRWLYSVGRVIALHPVLAIRRRSARAAG